MKILNVLAASVTMVLLANCAPTPATDGTTPLASNASTAQSCFFADQVRSFRSVDRSTILLDTGRRRTFQADSAGFCQDMDFAMSISIRPESSGTSRLCPGDHARLDVRGTSAGPCRVRIVKLLTEEEKASLEAKTS